MDPAAEPVRRAGPADVAALATLLARGRAGTDPDRAALVAARDRASRIVDEAETWVIGFEELRGALAIDHDRVVELVVDPALTRRGIGGRLVALVKHRRPDGVSAALPADDGTAARFLAGHGFARVDEGDPADATVWVRWSPGGAG